VTSQKEAAIQTYMESVETFVKKLNDGELVGCYGEVVRELKARKIITNKNITGELGEYLVINHYCNTPNLTRLQRAPTGTKNVDALSTQGDRYSIKTITSKTTGSFYDLEPKGSATKDRQVFEFLIIAILDENFVLNKILELGWDEFIKFKTWNSRMNNWNVTVTQKLISEVKNIL
jgi:hypothetical protein